MAVEMKTDHSNNGASHLLSAHMDDLTTFTIFNGRVALRFNDYEQSVGGICPEDLEDKRKHWKTDELIKQLEAWERSLTATRDEYKSLGGSYLKHVSEFHVRGEMLRVLITDLRNGEGIWE